VRSRFYVPSCWRCLMPIVELVGSFIAPAFLRDWGPRPSVFPSPRVFFFWITKPDFRIHHRHHRRLRKFPSPFRTTASPPSPVSLDNETLILTPDCPSVPRDREASHRREIRDIRDTRSDEEGWRVEISATSLAGNAAMIHRPR